VTYHWSGVWPETWSETSWPNPYRALCFGNSETKSWEWFVHMTQDQEKPKRRLTSQILTQTSLAMKGMKLKPSRSKSTINSLVPSKVKGWHHRIVLGEVSCMKDGCSKNLTCTSWSIA
jgi:hypothetical protein